MEKEISQDNNATPNAIDINMIESPIFPLLIEVLSEKKTDFSTNLNVSLELKESFDSHDSFALINPLEFKRHISNLLQNSFEAISDIGKITVFLEKDVSTLRIKIQDNGKGISSQNLQKIGTKDFSFGKRNGTGLGFYYAKEAVRLWGGSILISSVEGESTTVMIDLPLKKKPKWYCSSLKLEAGTKVVCVDDDITIFRQLQSYLKAKVNFDDMIYFEDEMGFKKWLKNDGEFEEKILFLFDYHLSENMTGIDIISKYGLQKESILVTTAYLEEEVVQQSSKLNLTVFPKSLL